MHGTAGKPREANSESQAGLPGLLPTKNSSVEFPYDLVCIGFGPASLSIAVALHDYGINARILFLERQRRFAWHSGMLIVSSRMQISFLKDLATFRDPRSHFTFLNYLKCIGRLEAFTNLGTFFPLREEFNDYLTWAAGHFSDCVQYGSEVQSIEPAESKSNSGAVDCWRVIARNVEAEEMVSCLAKNVVIAIGGTPRMPQALQSFCSNVIHSSQYLKAVPELLNHRHDQLRIAILGGGQSAAEIFNDLFQYPHVHATLFTSGSALKPSDDSPFVNEVFNSEQVDKFFALSPSERQKAVVENRSTNYSVVRPELLDRLYEKMYHQRLRTPNEDAWKYRIIGSRKLIDATLSSRRKINLKFTDTRFEDRVVEETEFDLVISGTGYVHNAHETILQPVQSLREDSPNSVTRDYRLRMKDGAVAIDCGIWLQGCCEESHGLSDTLLSLLAVRSGEIVSSIFGGGSLASKQANPARAIL